MDEENIVMEVTKQDVRGPRRDTDVTCWDFARRCVDLILSCTFMVVAFLQPCDKTNWKSFETVSLFHQTMGYWKFVVWLSSNSKVNLEAGKDKELFYKKTRLAWATWPARVGRLNTTTSTELEIPLFNKPVHMLFVWGPFRPQLFACFFFVSMFFVKCSFWGVFGILVIFRCQQFVEGSNQPGHVNRKHIQVGLPPPLPSQDPVKLKKVWWLRWQSEPCLVVKITLPKKIQNFLGGRMLSRNIHQQSMINDMEQLDMLFISIYARENLQVHKHRYH